MHSAITRVRKTAVSPFLTLLLFTLLGTKSVHAQSTFSPFCPPRNGLFSGFGGGVFNNFPLFGEDCEEPSSGNGGFGEGLGLGLSPAPTGNTASQLLESISSPFPSTLKSC